MALPGVDSVSAPGERTMPWLTKSPPADCDTRLSCLSRLRWKGWTCRPCVNTCWKTKDGHDLCAEDVYRETYGWLRQRKCEKLVSRQLIDQYAMSVARWIQCEQAISEYGFLAKHPTTGGAIASPFVSMAQQYLKQINQLWYQIYQVVKENCSVDYGGASPNDDLMERLLNARKDKP